MAVGVTIKRSATGEVALLIVGDGDNVRVATEREVARRFDLGVGDFEIFEDCDEGLSIRAMSKGVGDQREWYLRCGMTYTTVSYTHLRAHETRHDLVCRLLLEKKKKKQKT